MKIVILHDWFDKKGGGERLVLNLAKALDADVYTGFIDYDKTFEDAKSIKIISLNCRQNLPQFLRNMLISKKFSEYNFPKYDFYIFSGVWCISAAEKLHPNLVYLHTPARFLYDLKDYHLSKMSIVQRPFAKLFIRYWIPKDQKFMANFDKICANSKNVKNRVKKYYGENLYNKTSVVYTGFDTKKYKYKKSENFYLSPSRLDKLKRIGVLIEAFKQMPDKKLVIAGTGHDEQRLRKLAAGSTNIKFVGSVSEKEMLDLYSTCIATISANVDEDLGLVPLETHASGKPAIVVREGAFVETVKKTNGVFFEPNALSLIEAIKDVESRKWDYKKIQKSAEKYSIRNFVTRIKKSIQP